MNEQMPERPPLPSHEHKLGDRNGAHILAAATIVGIVACALLARPFLGALAWAMALAILFAPLHVRIEARLRFATVSAMVSVLIVALVVVVPTAFVVELLVTEAARSAATVQANVSSGAVQHLIELHPGIAPFGRWIEQQIDLPAIAASLAGWLSNAGASFARGSVIQLIEVVLTFYLLFYFLRDRSQAGRLLCDWLPLTDAEIERLFRRVVDTVYATIYGTLAVSAVQGALGGLMFWFLGLPAPVLWALVMGLLSIVPVLGAFVVWIPAAILLVLDGEWGKAIVLTVWGSVVVGGIDNVLRPVLVGNRLSLHTVPAFISMIGGLALFGAPGFVLGPLIVTVTILLVQFWTARAGTSSVA